MPNIIENALSYLEINQKDLANKLKVTSSQITQWKKNPDLIPKERRSQLAGLIRWGGEDMWSDFLNGENTEEWEHFFQFLFEGGNGYFHSSEFSENADYYGPEVMASLFAIGLETDTTAPEIDDESGDWNNKGELASLFESIIHHATTMSYYFEIFIYYKVVNYIDPCDLELETIRKLIIVLAMRYVNKEEFEKNNISFDNKRREIETAYEEATSILYRLCDEIISSRLPVQEDPLALIQKHPDEYFEKCDINFCHGRKGNQSFELQLPFWEREQIDRIESIEKKLNLIMEHLDIKTEH